MAATPLNAAEGAPAVFTVTGADPGATCTATETVPPGYKEDQSDCVDVPLGGSCEITNTFNVDASFDVYKHWNQDGVPITESVPVHIVCTSGEPTSADTVISVAQYGTFLIEDLPFGHNCTITEDVPDNYTATYNPPGAGGDEEAGCLFEDIAYLDGSYRCDIYNTPDEGSLTVTKTWILAGADAGYDGDYEIKVSCDTEVD